MKLLEAGVKVVIGLVAVALGMAVQAPLPPYRRLGTIRVFDMSYHPDFMVEGKYLYTASGAKCVAFDLNAFREAWEYKPPDEGGVGRVSIGRHGIYLATDVADKSMLSHLYCLDPLTGKVRWSMRRAATGSAVAEADDTLYLGLAPYKVSALDIGTRKVKWTASFPRPKELGFRMGALDAVAAGSNIVIVNIDNCSYGLSPADGHQLWKQAESYALSKKFVSDGPTVWVPTDSGSIAVSLQTGKQIWHSDLECGSNPLKIGNLFVRLGGGEITAIHSSTGVVAWSNPLGSREFMSNANYLSGAGDCIYARAEDSSGIFTVSGKKIWSRTGDLAYPAPCWTDGIHLVAFDGERLIRYVHGVEAGLPTDATARRALAEKLVANFDKLDESEKKNLSALGRDAFKPVLAAFLATCAAHDAMGDRGNSYPLYSKFHELGTVLEKLTTSGDAPQLMDSLSKLKPASSAKPQLLTLLAKVGDPKVVTPVFLKELVAVKTPGFEMYESTTFVARQYVMGSSDPRAVAFLLKVLKDPKGDQTIRSEAYVNLARTGGADGLETVIAMRHHRSLLRPISDRVTTGYLNAGEFGASTKVLAEKSDASGRRWGLLQSGVLGNAYDLWLAEKVGGKWTHALFTGVSNGGSTRHWKPAIPEPTIAGKTGKQLVAGAWFDTLVTNEEIRKDTDGDGLTDLEEKRLGTDPNKADTDGDGDPDGVDPWPNAKGEAKTDLQKVLAAVFEARYHFDDSEGPAILTMPKEIAPFEMPGRRGPTMWRADNHPEQLDALERCYENGVAMIAFQADRRARSSNWEENVVTWNRNHTEATTVISTYFGGLNGTGYRAVVRRFGDTWVVVSMAMEFVS